MIPLSAPLPGVLKVTPHGYYGAKRPLRNGIHAGLDFAATLGEPVVAAAAGKVARTGWDKPVKEGGGGGGNYVITTHTDQDGTVYELGFMHLKSIQVASGNPVQVGDLLGTAGATGTADGAVHLHFQIKRVDSAGRHSVDPTPYFPQAAGGSSASSPKPAAKPSSSGGKGLLLLLAGAAAKYWWLR